MHQDGKVERKDKLEKGVDGTLSNTSEVHLASSTSDLGSTFMQGGQQQADSRQRKAPRISNTPSATLNASGRASDMIPIASRKRWIYPSSSGASSVQVSTSAMFVDYGGQYSRSPTARSPLGHSPVGRGSEERQVCYPNILPPRNYYNQICK